MNAETPWHIPVAYFNLSNFSMRHYYLHNCKPNSLSQWDSVSASGGRRSPRSMKDKSGPAGEIHGGATWPTGERPILGETK